MRDSDKNLEISPAFRSNAIKCKARTTDVPDRCTDWMVSFLKSRHALVFTVRGVLRSFYTPCYGRFSVQDRHDDFDALDQGTPRRHKKKKWWFLSFYNYFPGCSVMVHGVALRQTFRRSLLMASSVVRKLGLSHHWRCSQQRKAKCLGKHHFMNHDRAAR